MTKAMNASNITLSLKLFLSFHSNQDLNLVIASKYKGKKLRLSFLALIYALSIELRSISNPITFFAPSFKLSIL